MSTLPRYRRSPGAIDAAYSGPQAPCASRGKNSVRGWVTAMPAISSRRGTFASLPALDQRARSPAPGNHGIVAATSSSQRRASAANCWRLNGADSGSAWFGKILVIARTRTARRSCVDAEDLVHPQQLAARQRLIPGDGDGDDALDVPHALVELDQRGDSGAVDQIQRGEIDDDLGRAGRDDAVDLLRERWRTVDVERSTDHHGGLVVHTFHFERQHVSSSRRRPA